MSSLKQPRATGLDAPIGAAGAVASWGRTLPRSFGMNSQMQAPWSEELVFPDGDPAWVGIEDHGRWLRIGGTVCHASVAASAIMRQSLPALAELAEGIGNPLALNLGTLGSAIAHADPAGHWAAALLGLEAEVQTERRGIPCERLFIGPYRSALQPGERVVSVSLRKPHRAAYARSSVAGAWGAAVGVFVSQGTGGVRVAVTGVRGCVFRDRALEAVLDASFTARAALGDSPPDGQARREPESPAGKLSAWIRCLAGRAVAAALDR